MEINSYIKDFSDIIISPDLNDRIYHILGKIFLSYLNFLVIVNNLINQIEFFDNEENYKDILFFIKLLSIDISPCLQKGILMVLGEFFRNRNNNTEKLLLKLEKENFIDLILLIYSNSLIDVKSYTIRLIKNMIKNDFLKNKEIYNKKILPFIKENLLKNPIDIIKVYNKTDIISNIEKLIKEKKSKFRDLNPENEKSKITENNKDILSIYFI